MVKVGKASFENQVKREIAWEWRVYWRRPLSEGTSTVTSITAEEVDAAPNNLKCDIAPDYDNVHPKCLKNVGRIARIWLAIILS